MAESTIPAGAPRKILLATDLSSRGDRALERALVLARHQESQLVILHVYEELDEMTLSYGASAAPSWRRPPDASTLMRQRIRQGLRTDLGDVAERASLLIEEGNPAEVIVRVAIAERPDVLVTGIARERPFSTRPVVVGRIVEHLLRRLPAPILIVRDRARDDYHHIVVTTDFSVPSAHALQLAAQFFPLQQLHLLHAAEPPYSTLVPDANLHAERFREARSEELEKFLGEIFLPPEDRRRVVPVVEPGPPSQIIREYVQLRGADLVVLGTHGRGRLLEALIGSTAKSILASLPCDALVVRAPD